jgi:hypothetical protein
MYVLSLTQRYIYYINGHNGHHQAMFYKNLKILVHIMQNSQFIWDSIYIYVNIH